MNFQFQLYGNVLKYHSNDIKLICYNKRIHIRDTFYSLLLIKFVLSGNLSKLIKMNKEYVLITGATGFIGSHVTENLLLEPQYHIITIVRKIRNYKNVIDLENKGVTIVEGNFYDKNLVEKIFRDFPIQHVIHIAALRGGGVGKSEDYYKVNVFGTEVLLEASLKNQIKKFIFCSSIGVFGTIPSELPANLNTRLNGDNEYHKSKILAEAKVQEFISKGLDSFIVRPTITYGKGDDGFPSILIQMVRNKNLLLSNKDNKVHLLDVNKLADIFIDILNTDNLKNRIFIAADVAPVSFKKLVNLIYFYYHKTNYPAFLRMPDFVFKFMLMFFNLINNNKWSARILFISKSWYYDTSSTTTFLKITPAKTEESFKKYLCHTNA